MKGNKKNGTKKKLCLLLTIFVCLCLCAVVLSVGRDSLTDKTENVLAAGEYAQTYEFFALEDFLDYSQQYAAGNRNAKDKLVFSLTGGAAITNGNYISLGTSTKPFAGEIVVSSIGMDIFYLYNCPLFNYVSTDLTVTGSGVIKIERYAPAETPSIGVLTSGALFANHVVKGTNAADWTIQLLPCSQDMVVASSHTGLIGDIADECEVTVSFTDTSNLPVAGTANTGLICGTLGEDAVLNVTTGGSGSSRALSTTNGHAGSLVGEMKPGSTLRFDSANNTRINSVTSSNKYAGGVVGYADDVTIAYDTGITDYAATGTITGKSGAGGVFGYYRNTTSPFTFTLEDTFTLSSLTLASSNGPTGGVFGDLVNTASSFTFDGNSESYSVAFSSGSFRGGVCGRMQTSALTDTISIEDVRVSVSHTGSQTSGGLVGTFTGSAAYVSASGISVTCSSGILQGGLIGDMGTTGSFVDVSGSITVGGNCLAGLVYKASAGVLRIQGTTDLGSLTQPNNSVTGSFVNQRGRSLVYALGDGSGTNGNWTLKRNLTNSIEDIVDWGQVIRTDGVILSESDLFTLDMTAHTVTVKQAYTTINNITQFALTALNIKLNTGAGVGALQFTSGNANLSSTLLAGTLTLGADISLAGTGLYGFARDDGANASFSGTFNGANHKITFATGKPYGLDASGGALAADSKQGNVYRHTHTGLFAETSGATVNNLTLVGDVIIRQTKDDMRVGAFTAYATNGLTVNNLIVPTSLSDTFKLTYLTNGDNTFYFGGAVGCASGNGVNISVTGGTILPTVSDATTATARSKSSYHGGVIGGILRGVTSPEQSVAFSGNTTIGINYTKSTNTSRESVFGGAIAYIENCAYVKDDRTVTFANTTLNVNATGTTGGSRFGGILGTDWMAVDVTITSLTINSDITATGSSADFGGLVMRATGGWSIAGLNVVQADYSLPYSGSTFGFVANRAYADTDTHTYKSALYLSVDNTGSNYNIGALAFSGSPAFSRYDEIVLNSRFGDTALTSNGNAIVSVSTSNDIIATSGTDPNTYLNKTAYGRTSSGRVNSYTRYYYNIEYARTHTGTAKYNFLTWSVKQYAHPSLADWFSCSSTFTGTLDMTGLSYYPIDLHSSSCSFGSATLKLDNNLMEDHVKYAYRYTDNGIQSSDTRTTRSNTNQHYLMHTSVFRNVTATITISGLTMQGNVPKLSDDFCGFFISGTLGGSDTVNARFTASDLVFDETKITTSAGANLSSDVYAPLFINKIGKSTTLSIAGAAQSGYTGSTVAASSLIGDVGNSTARAIYLSFTGLIFDSRSASGNIGDMDAQYGTNKSIFLRATILNSFVFFNESSGTYNFSLSEDWDTSTENQKHDVTYGKEITSSTERVDQQKKYQSSEFYTDPTTYEATSPYDFSSGFLPYVYVAYNSAEYKHELAINISISTTIEGCGKYGDPFIIDGNGKLETIATVISGVAVGDQVKIYLPSDLTSFTGMGVENTNYYKYLYSFQNDLSDLTSSDANASDQTFANVQKYLAGAYYVITRDVTLDSSYVGLGSTTDETSFRGVIIGRGNPTITNNSRSPLIKTSMGCVVQNLTVNVDVNFNSSDSIPIAAPDKDDTYQYSSGVQSYGAVIGQILGGDNFIDAVQVTFTHATFTLTASDANHFVRLTPVGGYVGTLVNGGLIFRNMTSSNVGLTTSTFDKVAENSGYLYVNPIIGRVIAGYAFHETSAYHATESETTLKNGTKNYTISDLVLSNTSAGKLTISYSSTTFTVTIPDGQALFLLGAIVNSGAASANYNGSSEQAYESLTAFWSAYREHTTVRGGADYSAVGTLGFASDSDYTQKAVNDAYTSNRTKIPYVIRAYTINSSGSIYFARCLSKAKDGSTDVGVALNVTNDCIVPQGFRGIGSIYYENDNVLLRIKSMNGNNHTITLHMRYLEYDHKNSISYIASKTTAGFGLFNILKMTTRDTGNNPTNAIKNIILSGSIFYDIYNTTTGTQVTYAFSAFTGDNHDDPTKLKNNNEDVVTRPTVLSVGGIGGFNNVYYRIHDVVFNGFVVEGPKAAGGLIGYTYNSGNNICYITYSSSAPNSGEVSAIAGFQAGGLVGALYKAKLYITGDSTSQTDIIIRDVTMKATVPNETGLTYGANNFIGAGGLVGAAWSARNDGDEKITVHGVAQDSQARRLNIYNINLTKGTNAATVSVENNTNVAHNNYAGGFIGVLNGSLLQMNNCSLNGVDVIGNMAGGITGKATQKYSILLENFTINGNNKAASITGLRYAGGLIGYLLGHDFRHFGFDTCTISDYVIESSTTTSDQSAASGGVIGFVYSDNLSQYTAKEDAANYICYLNNITVDGCSIKTNYSGSNPSCGTGGLIGTINSSSSNFLMKLSGYDILVTGCTITHKIGGSTDDNVAPANKKIGDIVGNNLNNNPIKFVGVSTQNASYCGRHVGKNNSDTENYGSTTGSGTYGEFGGYVIFADFNNRVGNTTFSGMDDGVADSGDEYTDVTEAAPYITAAGTISIGGITLTGDGVAYSVETLPINNIFSSGTSGRYAYSEGYYYNGSSGDNNRQIFDKYDQKLVMFTSEVTGYMGNDFPVLILEDTTRANSHEMINSYLRLLTNTRYDFGADITNVFSITIYNMTYSAGVFTPVATGASLKRTDGQFYMRNTEFDSGKLQFSLIDLRFYDPAVPSKVAYHLYVPVFVKKVLSYAFDIAMQSGTTYLSSLYAPFGQALFENVGTPVTAYFQYTYSRSAAEWTEAIYAGENVNRNYAKKLQLYKANTNDALKDFPSDTVLVLIDPNNGYKTYYATIGTALTGNSLNLSSFKSVMTVVNDELTFSGESFSPAKLQKMLDLSASGPRTTDLLSTDKFVTATEEDELKPTVYVGDQGYRLATTEELADTTVGKYTITVGASSLVEKYYLSIFTESTPANDLLFHYFYLTTPTAFDETDYPSKIIDTGAHTMVHLVMGKIFSHSDLTVVSSTDSGTLMTKDNNELTVTMSVQAGLSNTLPLDIKSNLMSMINNTQVYQDFLVYLNRKEGSVISRAIIGSPTGSGAYSVAGGASTSYTSGNIHVTQNYAEFITGDLHASFATGNIFTISSSVTLSYANEADILTQFPGQGATAPDNGVTISCASNLTFDASSAAYSKNTLSKDESPVQLYYSEAEPKVATLDLNPVGDKVGDFTPLGVNVLTLAEHAVTAQFDVLAVLDVTSVYEQLAGYTEAVISINLQQKQNDGSYSEPIDISEYITELRFGNLEQNVTDNGTSYSIVLNKSYLSDNGAEISIPMMHYTIKTGSDFENDDYYYGNYRINVNIVLRNALGSEYIVSRVNNYVVFTNAKVIPYYIY